MFVINQGHFFFVIYFRGNDFSNSEGNVRNTVLLLQSSRRSRRMSSILEKKKEEEGAEHVRLAEKYLKTAPLKLKFSPDWDPAGDEFSRAATCYKVAKNYEESKVYIVHIALPSLQSETKFIYKRYSGKMTKFENRPTLFLTYQYKQCYNVLYQV